MSKIFDRYLLPCPKCGKYPKIKIKKIGKSSCYRISICCPNIFHRHRPKLENVVYGGKDTKEHYSIEATILNLCADWTAFTETIAENRNTSDDKNS